MKNWWNRISDIGCYPELSYEEQRSIRLMNRINLISAVVLVFYITVDIFVKAYVFLPGLSLMICLIGVAFWLLNGKNYRAAKHFSILLLSATIAFFGITVGNALNEVLLVPVCIMPLVVFRDRRLSAGYIVYLVLLMLTVRLAQPYVEPLQQLPLEILHFFNVVNLVTCMLITYVITHYFKGANEQYEAQLIEVNELINEKNREITDSIYYARRIQRALLASEKLLTTNLPDHFVLYRPKDIVSGDFYWAQGLDNNRFLLATCDCTGHGVPGAFMSLLNISKLNETVNERKVTDPNEIFGQVREDIIKALTTEETQNKDGMDATLCLFDFDALELKFAAANNPVVIIRNGELLEFKPDKFPVGVHHGGEEPFTLHTVKLEKGDWVYTFTDGFADQFGGEKGKKFMSKRLKSIVLSVSAQSGRQQQAELESVFDEWKKDLEQVDDVLVIGVKI